MVPGTPIARNRLQGQYPLLFLAHSGQARVDVIDGHRQEHRQNEQAKVFARDETFLQQF